VTSTTATREIIRIPGVSHGRTPIPIAVKVGNLLTSSGIEPVNGDTGKIERDPEDQAKWTFANMMTILEQAGGTLDNIGLLTVYLQDMQYYPYFERQWLAHFPDAKNRPACRVMVVADPPVLYVQVQIIALL
jgi:2-iminobutanoate/2-iminopropanoate deaminase